MTLAKPFGKGAKICYNQIIKNKEGNHERFFFRNQDKGFNK